MTDVADIVDRLRSAGKPNIAIFHAERICTEAADEIERLREQLDSRAPCASCGCDNPRSGLYCSDACRARHARMYAPHGTVKSSRSIARGRWSLVIHFEEGDADRVSRFRFNDKLFVGEEND